MKEITAQSKSIKNLFEDNCFVIPVYQRNYSWNKGNVETLVNDIWNNDIGYYIGNVLLVGTDNMRKDVVDGQQRLTTIFLILLSIYEQFNIIKNKSNDDELKRASEEGMTEIAKYLGLRHKIRLKEQNQDLHLTLLEEDQSLLQSCIDFVQQHNENRKKPKHSNRILVLRYLDIKEIIFERIIGDDPEDFNNHFNRLDELYEKVTKAIALPIILEDLSDVFAIFSSMNSKGQPLTTIDLLKADYLNAIAKEDINEDLGLKEWNQFVDILSFGNNEIKVSEANRFLQNNYDAFYNKTSSSITVKQSLLKYQELIMKDQKNILSFIHLMQKNAKIYACIESNIDNNSKIVEEIGEENKENSILLGLKELQKLDVKSSYPILFSLLNKVNNKEVAIEDCEEVIQYIKHFYIRRNIINKPKSSNLRQRFMTILRMAEKESNFARVILEEMKKLAKQYLDDKSFKDALSNPIYSKNSEMARLLLESIEYSAVSQNKSSYFDKQHPYNLNDTKIWSIEHILPQDSKLKNGWDSLFSEVDASDIEEQHQYYANLLGNLTLTGYNSGMSNRSFKEKRDYKSKNGKYVGLKTNLYLNQSIFNDDFEKDTWTLEDIKTRTNYLADELVRIFNI